MKLLLLLNLLAVFAEVVDGWFTLDGLELRLEGLELRLEGWVLKLEGLELRLEG